MRPAKALTPGFAALGLCVIVAGAVEPVTKATLPPPPTAETTTEIITAHATQTESPSDSGRKIITEVGVSGWPSISHQAIVFPAEARDGSGVTLPDGRRVRNEGLQLPGWNQWGDHWHYSPWNFLNVTWAATGQTPTELTAGSLAAWHGSFQADGWASAELALERPLARDFAPRLRVRLKRVAGDPWLYLLLWVEAADGRWDGISLTGFPGCYQRPPFLDAARCVRIGDTVWDLTDSSPARRLPVTADTPGGVFWFNRRAHETGGMTTVFLPEQIERLGAGASGDAAWVSFAPRAPMLRLALHVWRDEQGCEIAWQRFAAELPARVQKLRELSFAWPVTAQLDAAARARGDRLIACEALPADQRRAARLALDAWEQSRRRIEPMPATDTPERFAVERAALDQQRLAEAALRTLAREWVAQGAPP